VGPNTYTVAADGRGTMTLNPGPGMTVDIGFYIVSAGEALIVSIDSQSVNSLFAGSSLKQSGGPFGVGSLSGTSILNIEGKTGTAGTSDVQIGFLSTTGGGSFTLTSDENNAGTISSNNFTGNYSVAGNGRLTITGAGNNPPVIYLVSPNKGFLVGTDNAVITGSFEPQATGPFSNASLSGSYFFGDMAPVVSSSSVNSGVASPDGVGTISGTSDNNSSGSLQGGQTFSAPYSVGTNGRVTIGSGSDTNVMYLVSSSKAVLISTKTTKTNPTITVVEK
jgi:hypothetical protein